MKLYSALMIAIVVLNVAGRSRITFPRHPQEPTTSTSIQSVKVLFEQSLTCSTSSQAHKVRTFLLQASQDLFSSGLLASSIELTAQKAVSDDEVEILMISGDQEARLLTEAWAEAPAVLARSSARRGP